MKVLSKQQVRAITSNAQGHKAHVVVDNLNRAEKSRSRAVKRNIDRLRTLAANIASGVCTERDARVIAQTTIIDPDTGKLYPPATFRFRLTRKGDQCEFYIRRWDKRRETIVSEFHELVKQHGVDWDRRASKVRHHDAIKATRNTQLCDGLDHAIRELMLTAPAGWGCVDTSTENDS